jgi:ubiquinone/menaquinone biosynthesis C-methylase UbiE
VAADSGSAARTTAAKASNRQHDSKRVVVFMAPVGTAAAGNRQASVLTPPADKPETARRSTHGDIGDSPYPQPSNGRGCRVPARPCAHAADQRCLPQRPQECSMRQQHQAHEQSVVRDHAPAFDWPHSIDFSIVPAMRSSSLPRPRIVFIAVVLTSFAFAAPAYAQLGARPTEDWLKTLDSANRVTRLKVDEAIAALKLSPGAVVADIGAGSGTFTLPLAKAVGASGKVYAVEIDQGLVDHIAQKAREAKATNVRPVLGEFTDPKLPARDVDVAFICDVLHHIENRAEYLKNLARYLKPNGRIAVIDFHPELGPHKNDPKLQVTTEQTKAWMAAAGLKPIAEHKLYTDKWYIEYGR